MIVLIGSAAAEHPERLGRGALGRQCADVDLITTRDQCEKLAESAKQSGQLVLTKKTHKGQKCIMVVTNVQGKDTTFDIELADPGDGTSSAMILNWAAEVGQSWPRLAFLKVLSQKMVARMSAM
jgi:hypothetical protein